MLRLGKKFLSAFSFKLNAAFFIISLVFFGGSGGNLANSTSSSYTKEPYIFPVISP